MTTSLSTRQGLLTKVSGKLSTLLEDAQQEATIKVPAEAERRNSYLQGKKLQYENEEECRSKDQRFLYEELSSIYLQMRHKEESVDNVVLQKQLLSKFSERIQRYVLKKKSEQHMEDVRTTDLLLAHVRDFLDTEAEIQRHIGKDIECPVAVPMKVSSLKTKKERSKSFSCFFCNESNHSSPRICTKYTTREERVACGSYLYA
ncbi:unnamed protein product [Heligmosomoides polygyrus]|uniref:CCHC-type domain-containing protein n=1 Tax=Heligmosomoides polygyrus TaxID=6339 RepID=A0A183GGT4_HELPZ|nr:unnamed protein product [Heligmosomoides polygyrus]